MPLQRAVKGDTVTYRKTTSKKSENATVRAAQRAAPDAPSVATFSSAGSLSNGTYSYRITQTEDSIESGPSTATTIVVDAGGSSNRNVITLPGEIGIVYNIYGRTSGSEELIATTSAGATSYNDTGSVSPSGALPTDTMLATVYLDSTRAEFTSVVPGYTGGTYSNVYPNPSSV